MSDLLPAWSERYHEGPGPAPQLPLERPITRAWAYGDGRGRGVRVAVVDSGIDAGHPMVGEVARSLEVVRDVDDPDGVAVVDTEPRDLYGHGTACAGIIRAMVPETELVSVRVLGANLKGNARLFAQGLTWCIDEGIDVVNLSLSTSNEDWFETFHELVDRANYAGVLLVSAMNNEYKTAIPSEFAGVFSVACAPHRDLERFLCAPGEPAEWAAPGIDVEVAWLGGGTMTTSGNSFAAPVIAGHLARLRGAHPGITPWQARTVLAELADNARPI